MSKKSETKIDVHHSTSIAQNVVIGEGWVSSCNFKPVVGENGVVRSGGVIYHSVEIGDYFQTGHNVVIREKTKIGDHVVLGTNTVVDGNVEIGSFVKIETACYIPTHVKIGSRVFFGPGVILTNDNLPLKKRSEYQPLGPIIEDGVTLGAGVLVMPGVTIGEGSFVAAGAIVSKDVPPYSFVIGKAAEVKPIPDALRERNIALSWMKYINEED